MKPIWIVDDDDSIRWVLEKALARENIALRVFSNADEVLQALQTQSPQVLVSDIRMPGTSGLTLLEKVHEMLPSLPIIIMTAFSDLDSAVSAFSGGAFDYLAKPFDLNKAVDLIKRAMHQNDAENVVSSAIGQMSEIIGQAPAMQELFRSIGKLSHSNATVLVTGESGTGKELVARALHRHSPRAMQPFIALNVAAIAHDLMESELFGHEKGAFTGAQVMRRGRFEQAFGGTLFLDEIGDMPLEMQTRLLRVLSDGHFYRVGGNQSVKANVRVIAATHQNLEKLVREGKFREDLFHRLNVIHLRIPSLRERSEDIPILAAHFLQKSARQLNVETKKLSKDAAKFLGQCKLTGNVRQLENICYWLTVMVAGQMIHVKDLPDEVREQSGDFQPHFKKMDEVSDDTHEKLQQEHDLKASQVDEVKENDWQLELKQCVIEMLDRGDNNLMQSLGDCFERVLIEQALNYTNGRKNEAAVLLGIGRNTIARKMQELGMNVK